MPQLSILVPAGSSDWLKPLVPPRTVITAGDTKVIWDSSNDDEVAAARSTFDRLIAKGYTAFRAEGKNGEKGEKITKFDPNAERMILVPRIQGGAA